MNSRNLLQSLKSCAGGRHQLCIRVGSPVVAILRPVATNPFRIEQGDIQRLTEWRNRHVTAFLTEFVATEERTKLWLTDTVGPDDTRILFMVETPLSKVIGYMGLAFIDWTNGTGEADAVVRGEDAPRGIMTQCLRTLLDWADNQLGIHTHSVRVRSDNSAIDFYKKFGFKEVRREALRKTIDGNNIFWQPENCANDYTNISPTLVHMTLNNHKQPTD